VVIVQSDSLNRIEGYGNVIVVPLTTKQKASATYVRVEPTPLNELDRDSWAITNQIFTLDKSDLKAPLGSVSKSELYAIKDGLRISLGIS